MVAVASTSRRIVGHTTADERTAPPIRPCSAKSSHRCGGRPWHDTTAFLVNAKKPTSNSVPDSNLLPFAGWWSSTSRTPDPCRGPPSATWDQTLLLWSIAARFGPSAPTRSGVQCCLHCSEYTTPRMMICALMLASCGRTCTTPARLCSASTKSPADSRVHLAAIDCEQICCVCGISRIIGCMPTCLHHLRLCCARASCALSMALRCMNVYYHHTSFSECCFDISAQSPIFQVLDLVICFNSHIIH